MGIRNAVRGIFRSRDTPTNSTAGSAYRFLFGPSTSGKLVTERSSMKMPAFAQQMGDIIDYRTMDYYQRRYHEGRE